jgi:hypothetical protein
MNVHQMAVSHWVAYQSAGHPLVGPLPLKANPGAWELGKLLVVDGSFPARQLRKAARLCQ